MRRRCKKFHRDGGIAPNASFGNITIKLVRFFDERVSKDDWISDALMTAVIGRLRRAKRGSQRTDFLVSSFCCQIRILGIAARMPGVRWRLACRQILERPTLSPLRRLAERQPQVEWAKTSSPDRAIQQEMRAAMYPVQEFISSIHSIEHSVDPMDIRRKSRDRYAVSPLLRERLQGKFADIVVTPKNKAELVRVVAGAVKYRIPITARGGGTANYGQSVPLRGGILLDMTGLNGIVWVKPGAIRALAGTIIDAMDRSAREIGWEMRMYPSTRATATIAGFIAGGTGGIGSAHWGVLRDRGNIAAVEVLTVEPEPRFIELRGSRALLAHHGYGANCLITEVEMPLVPAWEWRETIVAFPTYMQAVRCGVSIGQSSGIVTKLLSIHEWPTPGLMKPIAGLVPEGYSTLASYVAYPSANDFDEVVAEHDGAVVAASPEGLGEYGIPLYEMAFGHALAQIQKSEPDRTAIEGFFHSDDIVGLVERVHRRLQGVGPLRLELRRWGARLAGSGSPYVRFESEAQLERVAQIMQAEGAGVANSHASSVRAVGKKDITNEDIAFKRQCDPFGLLNPGRFEIDSAHDDTSGARLPVDAWVARRSAV